MRHKVYIYYLKETKDLYAFTESKEIKEEFEMERSMSLYKRRVKMMDDPTYQAFTFKNNLSMLFTNVLTSDGKDLSFATTYLENNVLETLCKDLSDRIESDYDKLRKFPLKKDINKLINELFEYYGDGVNESIYHFNTYEIFMMQYRNTIFH